MAGIIENKYHKMWVQDGVVHQEYKPELRINIDIAKSMVQDRLSLINGQTMPLLIDARNFASIDSDARRYLGSHDAAKLQSAGAIFINNYLVMLASNIFLNINKPPIPAKVFTDKNKAIRWLQQFRFIN